MFGHMVTASGNTKRVGEGYTPMENKQYRTAVPFHAALLVVVTGNGRNHSSAAGAPEKALEGR